MLTIACPNCKRVLRCPEESGEHRVVCPGCNAAFAVSFEEGVVRTTSTSLFDERPFARSSEEPATRIESAPPTRWISPVAVDVENDEASRRTRWMQITYVISSLILFTFFFDKLASEQNHASSGEIVLMAGFVALLLSVFVTIFVGYILAPAPANPQLKSDELLRRMAKAEAYSPSIRAEREQESPPAVAAPPPTDSTYRNEPGPKRT